MNTVRLTIILAVALLLGAIATVSYAATAPGAVTINRATERADGSPLGLDEIDGYNVRCASFTPSGGAAGACPTGNPQTFVDSTGAVSTGAVTLTFTASGTFCLEAQTVDTGGRVSSFFGATTPGANCKAVSISPPGTGQVTIAVVIGGKEAPVFVYNSNNARVGGVAGYVDLGVPCSGAVRFSYRGDPYRQVPASRVRWWNVPSTIRVAAPCRLSG